MAEVIDVEKTCTIKLQQSEAIALYHQLKGVVGGTILEELFEILEEEFVNGWGGST